MAQCGRDAVVRSAYASGALSVCMPVVHVNLLPRVGKIARPSPSAEVGRCRTPNPKGRRAPAAREPHAPPHRMPHFHRPTGRRLAKGPLAPLLGAGCASPSTSAASWIWSCAARTKNYLRQMSKTTPQISPPGGHPATRKMPQKRPNIFVGEETRTNGHEARAEEHQAERRARGPALRQREPEKPKESTRTATRRRGEPTRGTTPRQTQHQEKHQEAEELDAEKASDPASTRTRPARKGQYREVAHTNNAREPLGNAAQLEKRRWTVRTFPSLPTTCTPCTVPVRPSPAPCERRWATAPLLQCRIRAGARLPPQADLRRSVPRE